MKAWKRIEPTVVQQVGWRTIVTKTFLLPNGETHNYQTIDAEDSRYAGCIALTPDNQVIIARQYRPGPEKMMNEIPGGGVEEAELPEVAAARELLEETGYKPGSLELLGATRNEAYANATWYYYLALDCVRTTSPQQLDNGELVDVVLMSVDEFLDSALHNNMTDTDAVLLAYERLKKLSSNQ